MSGAVHTPPSGPAAQPQRFARGLVVGKFCPLHRGHELLINRAIAACNEVVVISYTKPEFDGAGRALRAQWLGQLFPHVRLLVVDDASLAGLCAARGIAPLPVPHNDDSADRHRQFCAWLCWHVLGVGIDAVFTSEEYGDGFAAALSVYFSAQLGKDVTVRHVSVDQARTAVPISGTRVRADPHAARAQLSPLVYASYVGRVVLYGGESSGKTTLAAALAARLGTGWVAEYGRELWQARDGQLRYDDMLAIGLEQVAREETAARTSTSWLVCDTSPLTTFFYSHAMFGRAEAQLEQLAERAYQQVFLCAPDFPFVQDGTRQDEAFRLRQHDWYVAQLQARAVPFILLGGTLEARLQQACSVLGGPAA